VPIELFTPRLVLQEQRYALFESPRACRRRILRDIFPDERVLLVARRAGSPNISPDLCGARRLALAALALLVSVSVVAAKPSPSTARRC